jgi:hypothetical protein
MKKALLVLFIIMFSCIYSFAQLKFGADVYSRYNWRGLDFGNSPAIQPSITYSVGGLSLGAWGSYSYPTDSTTYAENDLWISYSLETETAGTFSVLCTDYYIPSYGIPFGYFKPKNGDDAAHTIEGGLSYNGPEVFPITLSLYTNLSNDSDNSSYIQVGYPFSVDDATITLAAGFVPTQSAYYGTEKASLINLSITAAKPIQITDKFEIPINVSYIANPALDVTYLVFGASISF